MLGKPFGSDPKNEWAKAKGGKKKKERLLIGKGDTWGNSSSLQKKIFEGGQICINKSKGP